MNDTDDGNKLPFSAVHEILKRSSATAQASEPSAIDSQHILQNLDELDLGYILDFHAYRTRFLGPPWPPTESQRNVAMFCDKSGRRLIRAVETLVQMCEMLRGPEPRVVTQADFVLVFECLAQALGIWERTIGHQGYRYNIAFRADRLGYIRWILKVHRLVAKIAIPAAYYSQGLEGLEVDLPEPVVRPGALLRNHRPRETGLNPSMWVRGLALLPLAAEDDPAQTGS